VRIATGIVRGEQTLFHHKFEDCIMKNTEKLIKKTANHGVA